MYNACYVTYVFYKIVFGGNYMSEYSKKHPKMAETGETVLSLLSGGFAFLAILAVGIKQFIKKRKDK